MWSPHRDWRPDYLSPVHRRRTQPKGPSALLSRLIGFWAFLLIGVGVGATVTPVAAQDSTGTLLVTVMRRRDSIPISGAFIRTGRLAAVTNAVGLARLELDGRLWAVTVAHPAYQATSFEMTVLPNVAQSAQIYLADPENRLAPRVEGVTRRTGIVRDEPLRVLTYPDESIDRALQRRPADLLGLFDGTVARIQPMGGALDAARLQIHGLPGHYTGLMVDGVPVLAGRSGGFGLLQVGASDLASAELLPGPASAVHGATVGSGVLNLVSRRPDRDRARIGFDQSSEKGGDVFFWGARRFTPTTSGTVNVDFHQQRLVDADDDQWGEFPRAIRFSVRPRFFVDRPNGDGFMATAGFTTEDRTGGFLTAAADPNPYREERRTARGDVGLSAHRLDRRGGRFEARLAATLQSTSHRFDALRERDRRYGGFGEVSYSRSVGRASLMAGGAFLYEGLRQQDLPAFDYTHQFPSVFARVVLPLGSSMTGSISGRCDQHNVHGLQCMPRAALLIHGSSQLDVRLSAGDGYNAPTPLTDEVETIGLHGTAPVAARAERIRSVSADVRFEEGGLGLGAAVQYARVASPVRLVPLAGDPDRRLRLFNLSEPTRILSAEFSGSYVAGPTTIRAFYGIVAGSEGALSGTGRQDLTLTPTHSLGTSLAWRPLLPGQPIASLEASYQGPQSLADNPYLDRSPGYLLVNGVASLRSGRARLYLNGENLTDRKLGNYHSVLLQAPGAGGRRTVTPWMPLRGRVLSIGALVDW